MRNLFYMFVAALFAAAVLPVSAHAAGEGTDSLPAADGRHGAVNGACLTFDEESHDFGDIKRHGGDVHWSFQFENTGNAPLIITQVSTTCTCTKYKFPKQPIAPGARASIDVTFQPHKTEAGAFYRVLKVNSNSSEGRRMLIIRGNSIEK